MGNKSTRHLVTVGQSHNESSSQGELSSESASTQVIVSPWKPASEARKVKKWKQAFLRHLALTGNVTVAATLAGISGPYAYRTRKRYKWFRDRWAECLQQARQRRIDRLETSLDICANGYDDPIYQGGVLVGTRKRYSVQAQLAALQAEHPRKYARKQAPTIDASTHITVDARQANLRSDEYTELACRMAELRALARLEGEAGRVVDVTPQEERPHVATPVPTPQALPDVLHASTQSASEPAMLRKSIIAPSVSQREQEERPRKRAAEPRVQATPIVADDAWADEPWDD